MKLSSEFGAVLMSTMIACGGGAPTSSDGGLSSSPDGASSSKDGSTAFDASISRDGGASADGSVAPDGGTIGGTGAPAAPTKLRMVLQGQDKEGDTPNPPTPTNPNRTDISWTAAVAGANPVDHYKIYRSTNGTTYSAYGTSMTTTFSDTKATNCVSGTAGSTAPYYTASTYWYKVSAVDTKGTEGTQSTSQSFAVYEDGVFNWGGDFDFGGLTSNYAASTGTPESGSADIENTLNGAYGGWLPYTGKQVTEWNMWAGAFNNLEFDLKPTAASQAWHVFAVRVGDKPIYDSKGSQYSIDPTDYGPAPVVGTWGHYKVPLTKILTDYGPSGAGPAVMQYAVYKWTIQDQTGKASNAWYVDNVLYTP